MDFKTSDGIRINYYVYGAGKPVVLIHGFGGYQQIWCLQIKNLIQQGYQVITYDQRNHGASTRDEQLDSIELLIKDLYELLNYLNVAKPFLIGHSMGASVIYGFLSLYTDFPLSGVIAIDQSPKMLNTIQWPYGYMDVTRASYKLKLKDEFDETIIDKVLDTNEKVDISYKDFDETEKKETSDVTPKVKLTRIPVDNTVAPEPIPKAGSPMFIAVGIVTLKKYYRVEN